MRTNPEGNYLEEDLSNWTLLPPVQRVEYIFSWVVRDQHDLLESKWSTTMEWPVRNPSFLVNYVIYDNILCYRRDHTEWLLPREGCTRSKVAVQRDRLPHWNTKLIVYAARGGRYWPEHFSIGGLLRHICELWRSCLPAIWVTQPFFLFVAQVCLESSPCFPAKRWK